MKKKASVLKTLVYVLLLSIIHVFEVFSQCASTPVENLVRNGNFSAGNTQFTSGYSHCTTSNCLYPEGYYTVGQNANFYHNHFVGRDHTTGNGNFMIVNGTGVPNTIVWRQTITVKPGTDYNFSAWVMTLVASSPARLQFQINGVTIGGIFNAPATVADWQNFFVTWNSGAATSAVITILNQNTTLSGNDFGLDDISFIEICNTPQPNLGPDRLLCGVGSVFVSTNIPQTPTTNITWSDGVNGTGMGAPYTRTFTSAGTYWVCVQDGSCFKTDTLLITANFSIDLGPDFTLCASTAVKLDAGYGNAFTTYQWYKDGIPVSDSTARTFTVRAPGTYRVEVTDASCSLMRFDAVVVNATSATPVDSWYCPPNQAQFVVQPNPTGGFKWYDAPINGNLMGKGDTLRLSISGTQTMYAQDTTAFNYAVGPNAKFPNGFEDAPIAMNYIEFDALSSFTLDEVTVFAKVYNPNQNFTIGVTLRDNAGTFITQIVRTVTGPPIVPIGNDWPFTLSTGFNIPAGTGYRLSNEGTVGNILFWTSNNAANVVNWASYRVNGVIEMKGLDPGGYGFCHGRCYGFAYNWKISKGNNCARVPVVAQEECSLPVEWGMFEVDKLEQGALLQWETIYEKNTSHFIIERSADGKQYESVGRTEALGKSHPVNYLFTDDRPVEGTVYYRIKQYDQDGSYSYSVIRSITGHAKAELLVYPTKHQGTFTVKLNTLSASSQSAQLVLFNTLGAEVYKAAYPIHHGLLHASVEVPFLPDGIYLVKVNTSEGTYSSRCIKE